MSTYQEIESLKGWVWVLAIGSVILAFGWYNAANNSNSSNSNNTSSDTSSLDDNTSSKIDELRDALYQSNETIDRMNSCIDSSHDAFEAGEFDDGLSELENCTGEQVSIPSST